MSLIEGLRWSTEGAITLSGRLLSLYEKLDQAFVELASGFGASPEEHGPLLNVRDLRKIDYFSSFPHLLMFPARAASDPDVLHELARANDAAASGPLHVSRLAPATTILAPAACYGVYICRSQTTLADPQSITVRGTCFRAESTLLPLVRQPSFSMREIVHLGTAESVDLFLREATERVLHLAGAWRLEPSLQAATDPFFDPARSPKYLHAKLFPSKHELIDQGIAVASFNNHRNFFGEAFGISMNGQPAHSACVAFGLERWLHAVLQREAR